MKEHFDNWKFTHGAIYILILLLLTGCLLMGFDKLDDDISRTRFLVGIIMFTAGVIGSIMFVFLGRYYRFV